jgi:ubiquinone/menaquinone biosynthesis C-methylase UbiE
VTSRALSFGRAAAEYEHGRPGWPVDVVDRAAARLHIESSATVLDLGAGTGKLTQLLPSRFARVIAIEPDEAMRALLGQVTDCHLVLEGSAEAIPLPDDSVDAVFAGDAFHWFANATAVGEIARVLRPAGGLAVLRMWWESSPELPATLKSELDALTSSANTEWSWGPDYATEEWFDLFRLGGFEEPHVEQLVSEIDMDADRLASLWLSVSSVAMQPVARREAMAASLRASLSGAFRLKLTIDLYCVRLT